MKLLIILVVGMASFSAFGKLGETPVQVQARYGAPVKRLNDSGTNWTCAYTFKEYRILVAFERGLSTLELIRPIEDRKFSAAERDALMTKIGGDGKWVKDKSSIEFLADTWFNSTSKTWARVESKIMGADTLFVMTDAYVQAAIADKEKNDKAKADGF